MHKKTEMNIESISFGHIEKPASGSNGTVKKSSSFNGNKAKRYSRRKLHTVPSDKGEHKQIETFRRECLSKAIQWNMVDILKQGSIYKPGDTKATSFLTNSELKKISELPKSKQQNRIFICFLKEKSFDTMQEWLSTCELDEKTVLKVQETYSEFSNKDKNEKKMKCFLCRLMLECPVSMIADHLFSANMIEKNLYERCFTNEAPIGFQQELWRMVVDQFSAYPKQNLVFGAIEIALDDAMESEEGLKVVIENLLTEMQVFKNVTGGILICSCAEKCIKALHPVSCVKTYPSIPLYFRRKNKKNGNDTESSDSDPSQTSRTGRSNGDDTGEEADCEYSTKSSSSSESLTLDQDQSPRSNTTETLERDSKLTVQRNPGYVKDELKSFRKGKHIFSKHSQKGDVDSVKRIGDRLRQNYTGTRLSNRVFLTCDNAYFNCSNNYISRK